MNHPSKYSKSRQKGNMAENIACLFLVKRGYAIIQRNYLKYCGEIDVIAQKEGKLHFFEIKSVSHETVTHETIRPEENMTKNKLKKLARTIETYLSEEKISHETEYQTDLITVRMNTRLKIARIEYFPHIL
jgi:putative endonuclease